MKIKDTLQNLVSGLGVWGKDKAAHRQFNLVEMAQQEVEAAYRGDWVARKIVDIPAFDMTRAWRTMQIDKKDITLFEAEERRLGIRPKVHRAIWLARLYGGSGLVLDDGALDLRAPLNVTGKAGLKAVLVLPRHRLTAGPLQHDPYDEGFDEPTYFNMAGGERGTTEVHPSRVITFMGAPVPDPQGDRAESTVYGDSILMALRDAVMDAASVNANIASMIEEAKVDVIKVPGLLGAVLAPEYRNQMIARWELAAVLKSIHNVLLMDGAEEWERKQVNFAGLPDVQKMMLQIVSGAADIPATRFLGQSPAGMNSTGDSDLQNYDLMISAKQGVDLTPRMDRLDESLLMSALGSKPEGAHSRWNPLRVPTPKESAEIETARANAARTIVDSGLVPMAAMEVAFQNRLIEDGVYPGLEQAIKDAKAGILLPFEDPADENDIDPRTGQPMDPEDPRNPIKPPAPANENEPREITVNGGKVAIKAGVRKPARDTIVTDAKPRTLYVHRKLLNAEEVIAWARGEGFEVLVPAGEMHVTVALSRQPVDWMKVPTDWWSGHDEREAGILKVPPGGARLVEPVGDKGAIALLFSSNALQYRHNDIQSVGASWPFEEYQPHVTLTYQGPAGLDLDKVKPFLGRLRFGPEVFEEVVEDWAKKVIEQ